MCVCVCVCKGYIRQQNRTPDISLYIPIYFSLSLYAYHQEN